MPDEQVNTGPTEEDLIRAWHIIRESPIPKYPPLLIGQREYDMLVSSGFLPRGPVPEWIVVLNTNIEGV